MTAACTKAKKAAEIEILETFYDDLEKSNVDAYQVFNELKNFLQSNNGYTLSIANAVFYQNGFLSDTEWAKKFKNNKRLQSMKPIDVFSTNLASESGRQEINSFINEKTNGKIPEMYKDVLDKDTLIALVSSLYFKASWAKAIKFRTVKNSRDKMYWTSTSNELQNDSGREVPSMITESQLYARTVIHGQYQIDVINIPLQAKTVDGFTNQMELQLWVPKEHFLTDEESNQDI